MGHFDLLNVTPTTQSISSFLFAYKYEESKPKKLFELHCHSSLIEAATSW